jgi:hypothetical protein
VKQRIVFVVRVVASATPIAVVFIAYAMVRNAGTPFLGQDAAALGLGARIEFVVLHSIGFIGLLALVRPPRAESAMLKIACGSAARRDVRERLVAGVEWAESRARRRLARRTLLALRAGRISAVRRTDSVDMDGDRESIAQIHRVVLRYIRGNLAPCSFPVLIFN